MHLQRSSAIICSRPSSWEVLISRVQSSTLCSTLGSKCQTDCLGLGEHKALLRSLPCVCVRFPFFCCGNQNICRAAAKSPADQRDLSRIIPAVISPLNCNNAVTLFTFRTSAAQKQALLLPRRTTAQHSVWFWGNKSSGGWKRGEKLRL